MSRKRVTPNDFRLVPLSAMWGRLSCPVAVGHVRSALSIASVGGRQSFDLPAGPRLTPPRLVSQWRISPHNIDIR